MRLTCPNCGAQYEVPDDVIPTSGRDVQCSSCSHTWYQNHTDHPEGEEPKSDEADSTADDRGPEDEDAPEPSAPESGEPDLPRRQLDPTVVEILRQEAEAEQAARRRRQEQAETLESQPDLCLTQPEPESEFEEDYQVLDDDAALESQRRTLEARQRMAELRGAPVPRPQTRDKDATAGRGQLPDIDKITSTLRSDNERRSSATGGEVSTLPVPRRRSGFRSGFALILTIALLMGLLYAYAPQIARAVPQTDPYLSSFVAWVDEGRVWLDGLLRDLLSWLDGSSGQTPDAAPAATG